ncbi:uncharacterized protein LOC124143026 [Haliotis rufescens]|uniref:uncharacterized protein LOC124143026 n=1 Tax=Haliotis rufescens TaxID=6454 RepID=UPI00201F8EA9|nr:uncharacterized protein LOC124143026 [Haliotis rufescens]
MASCLFVAALLVAVAAADIGLPCMQADVVARKTRECFAGLGRENLINLDPTKQGGSLGQMSKFFSGPNVCSHTDDMAYGINCMFDFYGTCLNIRRMFASYPQIKKALVFACQDEDALNDSCVKDVDKDTLVCYIKKEQERSLKILTGEVQRKSTEEEMCGFLKEEMKCMKKALSGCPVSTGERYYSFVEMLMPTTCDHLTLYRILKERPKVDLATTYIKSQP